MGFQVVHFARRHACPRQRRFDDLFLGGTFRRGRACAGAALVDRAAADHALDTVAVGLRVSQPLQYQHPATFTAYGALRRGIEGPAGALARQHAKPLHLPG